MFYLMLRPEELAKISGIHLLRVKRIFVNNDCTFHEISLILKGLEMTLDEFFAFTPHINK
jgi:hypothetical protein